MKILMLTPYLPYPLLSGGQIRTYNLLKHLSKKHQITLFSLIKEKAEEEYLPKLEPYCYKIKLFQRSKRPFTPRNIIKTGFSSFPFVVTRNLVSATLGAVKKELETGGYDLIHAETFYMMPNIPPNTNLPVILVEQTIEYLGYQSYADSLKFWPVKPLLAIDIRKIRKWETNYWKHADRLITMSDDDRNYILNRYPGISKVDVVANGVDIDFFVKTKKMLPKDPTVLIVGTFKWLPNIEAVTYLVQEIWPLVLSKLPQAKLHIVGFSPTAKIQSYNQHKSITVSGNVKDIRDAYAKAHVLLAPVKSGKGTRYKVLEAMATGTPIVATPLAVEGITGIKSGVHAMVGKSPDELATKTIRVLTDFSLQNKLALNSRRLVSNQYGWPKISNDLDSIYQEYMKRNK